MTSERLGPSGGGKSLGVPSHFRYGLSTESMVRYLKKEVPSTPLYLKSGKKAPFKPSKYEGAILATNNAELLTELDGARARGIGGLTEISENEYLILRDGERPKLDPAGPHYRRLKTLATGLKKVHLIDSQIRTVGQFIHVVERHSQRD